MSSECFKHSTSADGLKVERVGCVDRESVGTAATMGQAVRCLGVLVRAAIVALSRGALSFLPYTDLINKEAEVIGVADHLASELPALMRYAQSGKLTFLESALRFVDLDSAQINAALGALERSTEPRQNGDRAT